MPLCSISFSCGDSWMILRVVWARALSLRHKEIRGLYEDVFRDVLIVKKEAPEVRILTWDFGEGWSVSQEEVKFSVGDRITCRAFGSILALSEINDPDKGREFAPEGAPRILAKDIQNCAKLDGVAGAAWVVLSSGIPVNLHFVRRGAA